VLTVILVFIALLLQHRYVMIFIFNKKGPTQSDMEHNDNFQLDGAKKNHHND